VACLPCKRWAAAKVLLFLIDMGSGCCPLPLPRTPALIVRAGCCDVCRCGIVERSYAVERQRGSGRRKERIRETTQAAGREPATSSRQSHGRIQLDAEQPLGCLARLSPRHDVDGCVDEQSPGCISPLRTRRPSRDDSACLLLWLVVAPRLAPCI
jgi:hypothetical protein